MKKQYIYLILLSGVLVALILLLRKAQSEDVNSTHDQRLSDFAVEDTASIDKIVITDVNGEKAEVVKKSKDHWILNGKYKARIDAVRVIMKTAKLISVKSEVPESATKNVLKTMAVSYKKVQFYSGNTLLKTWYVGSRTRDAYGTYMLLEHPDENRSVVPYIMEIKGFFGHLSTRFFTDELEWRDKVILALEPAEISKIDFENNENPEYGFHIEVKGKNDFNLYDYKNSRVNGFDTVSVRSYLLNFRKIAFEAFNKGILNENQEDSLRKAIPFAKINITDTKGNSTLLKMYRKEPSGDQQTLEGQNYQWDIERLYGILPSGEIVIMQYGTVDKIWRAIVNFIP